MSIKIHEMNRGTVTYWAANIPKPNGGYHTVRRSQKTTTYTEMQHHVAEMQIRLGCTPEARTKVTEEEESATAIHHLVMAAKHVKGVVDTELQAMFCASLVLPGNTLVIIVEEWSNSDYCGLLTRANRMCEDVQKVIVLPKQGTGPILYLVDNDDVEEWQYLCEASCASYL